MNWAMPWAPAGDRAKGLKLDSAISCAASRFAETFQRAAARRIGARKRSGTKPGRPAPPASLPSAASRPKAEAPAVEQGAGPRVQPKCQASQELGRFLSILPRLEIPA